MKQSSLLQERCDIMETSNEKRARINREWKEANRERVREKHREWQRANADRVAEYQRRYWKRRIEEYDERGGNDADKV